MSAFGSLQADSALSYLIALVIPALDAIFPVLPGETVVIALGVATAGSTDPRIAVLVGCAAAGAFLGDNLCYVLGRRFGPAVQRRFFSTAKGMKARAWAERSLARWGMQLIVVCRFLPGGRTAVTLTCGLTGYPRRASPPRPRWPPSSGRSTRSSPAASAAGPSPTTHGPGSSSPSAPRSPSAPGSKSSAVCGHAAANGHPPRPRSPCHGVTPDRWSPITPARIRAIEDALRQPRGAHVQQVRSDRRAAAE